MAEEQKGVDLDIQGGQDGNQPELVEVDFNNEKVMVPKATAEKFSEMEHNLKSGYDAILATERGKITEEQTKNKESLNQDLINVNALMEKGITDFSQYRPLVEGGDGQFHGTMPTAEETIVNEPVNQQAPAFNNDDMETKINKRVEEAVADAIGARDANNASQTAREIATKFPGSEAYLDSVIRIDMADFHRNNGRAPAKNEIHKMISERHSKLKPFIKQDTTTNPSIPSPEGGGRPIPPKLEYKKGMLDDTDAVVAAAVARATYTEGE